MNPWKVFGLAGIAGVAAAGVIIAREQRQRTQLAPEEIRSRLHERLEQVPTATTVTTAPDGPVSSTTRRQWLSRLSRLSRRPRRRVARISWRHGMTAAAQRDRRLSPSEAGAP
jgi:hypothetical protein